MFTQLEKAKAFQALHQGEAAFIIPNPWDVGTARLLAHLGFEALATTSVGYAFSVGPRDNTVDRERVIAHVSAISSATELPVSADLENGFGDSPEAAAETIRLAAAMASQLGPQTAKGMPQGTASNQPWRSMAREGTSAATRDASASSRDREGGAISGGRLGSIGGAETGLSAPS